jgi:hypothetical protein
MDKTKFTLEKFSLPVFCNQLYIERDIFKIFFLSPIATIFFLIYDLSTAIFLQINLHKNSILLGSNLQSFVSLCTYSYVTMRHIRLRYVPFYLFSRFISAVKALKHVYSNVNGNKKLRPTETHLIMLHLTTILCNLRLSA